MEHQTRLHRSSFLKELRAAIPEVEPFLEDYRDNLTMELLALTLFTQDAIATGKHEILARTFSFVDAAFRAANPKLRNAIVVSYLEDLDFSGSSGQAALTVLSPLLDGERTRALAQLRALGSPPPNPSLQRTRPKAPRR